VPPEVEMVEHAHNVTSSVGVGPIQQLQHAHLLGRLAAKTFFTADDLERHPAAFSVIERTHDFAEATPSQQPKYFIAEQNAQWTADKLTEKKLLQRRNSKNI
jgi:hypothetical protein